MTLLGHAYENKVQLPVARGCPSDRRPEEGGQGSRGGHARTGGDIAVDVTRKGEDTLLPLLG